jgi:hypothetical protein
MSKGGNLFQKKFGLHQKRAAKGSFKFGFLLRNLNAAKHTKSAAKTSIKFLLFNAFPAY